MSENYKDRAEVERSELLEKLTALTEFIENNKMFDALDKTNKTLLIRQEISMQSYYDALSARIDGFM